MQEIQFPFSFSQNLGGKPVFPYPIPVFVLRLYLPCLTGIKISKHTQGFEDMIKQAHAEVEYCDGPYDVRLHVFEGHYDLVDSDDVIILPSTWEQVIRPDMSIKMLMWPPAAAADA